MKLLLATDEYLPHPGGVSRVILETSRRLQGRGHEVTILTFDRDPNLPRRDEVAGVPVQRLPLRGRLSTYPRALLSSWRASREYVPGGAYDLLHIHLPLIGLGALLARGTRQVPRVYTFHGPWHLEMEMELRARPLRPPERALYGLYVSLLCWGLKWWQGWVMRHCDRVMVLSEYSRQQIGTLFPSLNPDHVVLIPGGVDVERFRPASDRLAVRARLGLPQNGTILLTVRRLVPRMGLENLLRAFAQVSVVQDDLTLVIGGHGRLESALRVLAAQLGVSDRVQFAGFIPEADLPAYYQAADLFVLPTQALEGFGLITLEALASGLPVVGTPVGSTKEILTRFDARFLTRGTTVSDLVEKIVEVQHILRQETVASRARSFAVTHYDWDSIVDCYEDLYQQLCVTEQA